MIKIFVIFSAAFVTAMMAAGVGNASPAEVEIGSQVWMAENLNVNHFRNGDPIPQAKTAEEWENAGENGQPAWCYYENDPANGAKYGKLYNWYAVNDPRGLAPEGWRIPSHTEWMELEDFLGENAGPKLKSASGWEDNGNGTNESGFSGLPGGIRSNGGIFRNMGRFGYWWSSTDTVHQHPHTSAWLRSLFYYNGLVNRLYSSRAAGFSVRCLKD